MYQGIFLLKQKLFFKKAPLDRKWEFNSYIFSYIIFFHSQIFKKLINVSNILRPRVYSKAMIFFFFFYISVIIVKFINEQTILVSFTKIYKWTIWSDPRLSRILWKLIPILHRNSPRVKEQCFSPITLLGTWKQVLSESECVKRNEKMWCMRGTHVHYVHVSG